MNKGLMIFIAVGALMFYLVTNFVGKLKNEDERLLTSSDKQAIEDKKSYRSDVAGDMVIVKSDEPIKKRIELWKRSPLHIEYINLFPDFSEMTLYVDDRIYDAELKSTILNQLKKVESDFFTGAVSPVQAKENLDRI
jgi:hypothetical protein